ncbi:MAG TPA: hypothetical protein VM599_11345 [Thermoanaerobaculia bacterium]|nr:hypothetical protein [Thermoanaerobaculia bacterium]
MARPFLHPLALALLGGALLAATLSAAELTGSAVVSMGATDVDGAETEDVDQQYAFSLFQRFTPYLSLRAGASALDFSSDAPGGEDFSRRSREPRLELLYGRPALSARLAFLDRVSSGSSAEDDFEVESLTGNLTWRTPWGPALSFQLRDESNVADVAVFGRDTDSRTITGSAVWSRSLWSTGYTVERFELDNRLSGLTLEQTRQDLRLDAGRRFFGDRLALDLDSRVSRLDRSETVPAGAGLAEPLPARQGLFAVDTSPEVGSLEPAPGLVDGDFATPAVTGGVIGGANTFRNFGVDLGLPLPVTRLEVAVDAPTGAEVVWGVWRSADNLLWQRVAGVVSELDPAFLRYTLRFPETTERFFKAVNLTVNPAVGVSVTELRALRDVDRLTPAGGEANLYRADLSATYRPVERVTARVNVGASEDESLTGQVARRRFEEVHAGARLDVGLPGDLRLQAGYQYLDFENRIEPVLLRTETVYDAGLVWTPLPTLDAALTTRLRDELEEGREIRSIQTTRLRVLAELLPDLRLTSELERSRVEDPLSGLDRDGWAFRQLLDARPTDRWSVAGGWSLLRFEDSTGRVLLDRLALDLQSTWLATPYLYLVGAWSWSVDETTTERTFLRQSYTVAWSPGTKLSTSASWESFEDQDLRQTTTSAASASYRLTQRFSLFGNLTRSTFDETGGEARETTSFRTGISLFI